jgi:septum site-determining protein MinD
MISGRPKVITLLSGKGGAGKSTVAISMAKILTDLECPCLLIDFDLSTNGASYFFQPLLSESSTGIWELLASQRSASAPMQVDSMVIRAENGLNFVPSRARLGTKGLTYEQLPTNAETLQYQVLSPLIDWAKSKDLEYVLIDCQAGYSESSVIASRFADMGLFVSEADAISSDAAENLRAQLGDELSGERRFLINKIDVRDADTYRTMTDAYVKINRLPPLPFDYSVRNAFGARQMPVRTDEPSSVLFALFETMDVMLPELHDRFVKYREQHINRLFAEYNERFDELLTTREKLEREMADVELMQTHRQNRTRRQILVFVAIASLLSSAVGIYLSFIGTSELTGTVTLLTAMFAVGISALVGLLYQRREWVNQRKQEEAERVISLRMREVEKQLDQYRSLLWSQSKDYLLDDQIARQEAKRDVRSTLDKPSR